MKKRSAMLIAAGLVAALLAGGTALSFSLADGPAAARERTIRPIVKTRHRTITVHKRAEADPERVVTIVSQPSTSTNGSVDVASASSDDAEQEFEGEDHEDDQYAEHEEDTVEAASGDGVQSDDSGGDD
jgi:hypothetical protein